MNRRVLPTLLAVLAVLAASPVRADPPGPRAAPPRPPIVDLRLDGETARITLGPEALLLDEVAADAFVASLHAPGSPLESYARHEMYVRLADGTVRTWAELRRIPAAERAVIDAERERNLEAIRGAPPPVGWHGREGALAGRRVVISPGHGYLYYDTLGTWSTQRGDSFGLIEDHSNAEIAAYYVIPYLERMGAQVFSARERATTIRETVVDNDDGGDRYLEEGTWGTGSATGYRGTYRHATVAASGGAIARFRFAVPEDDTWPVYARWIAGTNRSPSAVYEVVHAGGTTPVVVNQRAEDARWLYLGGFFFRAGVDYEVRLVNRGTDTESVVIADAVRIGGGMGDVVDGGMTSGQPRWRECAWAWVRHVASNLPPGVLSRGDVTVRPAYADWEGADAYLSIHSNAGGGRGSETYVHDTAPSAGSAALCHAVHASMVHAIRTLWDPEWRDRGEKTADFGEVRECRSMPATLTEIAFHDDETESHLLQHPRFRHDVGRALAIGIQRYLAPGTPAPPLPPERFHVRMLADGRAEAAWRPATDAAFPDAVPDRYRVYLSRDGRGFDDANPIESDEPRAVLDPIPRGETRYLRVTAVNAGGESFPTEVLGVRPVRPPTPLLVVNGFDRRDRFVREPDNTFDYVSQHGDAIAWADGGRYGFDSASNEALVAGDVALDAYRAIVWILGEESVDDRSFDADERALVDSFLAAGGSLFVSEGEMGWDLVERGTPETTAWLERAFHATYVHDDAGTYAAEGAAGGLFDGVGTVRFDDGTHGTYDVDYPDVYAAGAGAAVVLSYDNGAGGAAIAWAGDHRTLLLGFPFETIVDAETRRTMMTRILGFLLPGTPDPVEGDEDAGGDVAGDAGEDADAGTGADAPDDAADAGWGSGGRACDCRAAGAAGVGPALWLLLIPAAVRHGRRRARREAGSDARRDERGRS